MIPRLPPPPPKPPPAPVSRAPFTRAKTKDDTRPMKLNFRVSAAELRVIATAAKKAALGVATYARFVVIAKAREDIAAGK